MMKLAITVFLGAALSAAAPLAIAQAQDAPRIVVKYGDLDLKSPAGRQAFAHRLAAGVTAYCGGPTPVLGLTSRHYHQVCVREATEKTLVALRRTDSRFAEIDTPMVLAGR